MGIRVSMKLPRKRQKICITIPTELVKWIDEKVKTRVYANRSHLIEVAVLKLKEAEQG